MAEEGKSQKFIETNKAVAAGIASVVTAIFTSKLGVAGTLIGTALTATLITLISAILKAQLEKASHRIVGLPDTVRGRLPTQQIRIPGKPNPVPNPEPAARPEVADGRSSGLLSRLRAIPGFLRDLPSAQRRKVLLAGLLAGLAATVIGLSGVTGIELVGGKPLSCLVWTCEEDSDSEESSGRSGGLSIFGGYSGTLSTPSGSPPREQPLAPGNDQQIPQQRQPAGQPAQPGAADEAPRQQPGETPKGTNDEAQPGEEPNEDGKAEP